MADFIYHGSSINAKILQPHQASDWLSAIGNLKGVYATSNRDLALAFSLGAIPDESGSVSRYIKGKNNEPLKMVYVLGHPNFGGKGYLYVLRKENFIHLKGTIWISRTAVKPLQTIEINVDDYLHLFRYATKKEKEAILKESKK
jgi:hypothetical protein